MRIWPKVHYTMGGVQIDVSARVIDRDHHPISGLYAAGEVTGGIHGACRIGSCAVTECLVMGRIAGREASHHDRSNGTTIGYISNTDTIRRHQVLTWCLLISYSLIAYDVTPCSIRQYYRRNLDKSIYRFFAEGVQYCHKARNLTDIF